MPLDIILGAQWGDEGKGRITDLLASDADIVARYCGGDNAGHTISVGQDIFKLHLVPSGIIHPGVICLIGNGVVINPAVLLREMDALSSRGVDVSARRLRISRQAHLLTPAHIALDKAGEDRLGGGAVGTTQRGIGPAYTDKTSRVGLRLGLLENPVVLAEALQDHIEAKNEVLANIFKAPPLNTNAIVDQYATFAKRLKPYLEDCSPYLNRALEQESVVLAEGAQGTFLDLDHGTYPFVTSSSTTSGGALIGLGVGPKMVRRVIGVTKAFTSRVGSGPFPCQLEGKTALRLRGTGDNPWDEYGTTTGRPRRVGWLDLVLVRQAARINGMTELALTKLDILSELPTLSVCVAYELNGTRIEHVPSDPDSLARCRPIYETLEGWQEDICDIRRPAGLPVAAQRYVEKIADFTGISVSYISVGPAREQVIMA